MAKKRKKAKRRPSKRRPLKTRKKRKRPLKFPKVRDWSGGFAMKVARGKTVNDTLTKNSGRVLDLLAATEGPAQVKIQVTMRYRRNIVWRDMQGKWRDSKGRLTKTPSEARQRIIKRYRRKSAPKDRVEVKKIALRRPVRNRRELKRETRAALELAGLLKRVDSPRGRRSPWSPQVEIVFNARPLE